MIEKLLEKIRVTDAGWARWQNTCNRAGLSQDTRPKRAFRLHGSIVLVTTLDDGELCMRLLSEEWTWLHESN
jgi:hypothetical protein